MQGGGQGLTCPPRLDPPTSRYSYTTAVFKQASMPSFSQTFEKNIPC